MATWKSEAWTPLTAVLKVTVQLTLVWFVGELPESLIDETRGATVSLLVVPVLAAEVLVPVLVGNSTVALIVMLLVPSLSAEASIPLIVTLVVLSAGIVGD